MDKCELRFTVNGQSVTVTANPRRTLLQVLRDDLDLTGTKEGCGRGDCGTCTIIMNGLAVNSCLVLVPMAEGAEILTVEGLAIDGGLHPLQRAFMENWALQCGYCTPGMLMSCYALLLRNPKPSPEEIRRATAGNLCRCTGYQSIIEAVRAASRELSGS